MEKKSKRLLAISQIINTQKISSQADLLNKLQSVGIKCTQATLSRDLRVLKVGKIANNKGGYNYSIITNKSSDKIPDSSTSFVQNGFVSLEFAQKLALIKTIPAYASSLAMTIDMEEVYEIAGTIAGDDTILIIPRDGISESDIRHRLILIFPELKDRIRH
ncbi:MAG: arginine repressor [Bacteroidota bacterium]|nr:arginine repressor [Bacteroidota bacterium]